MTLTLSEIDHPPRWLGKSLQVTATACLLNDKVTGGLAVRLGEPQLIEVIQAWMDDAPDEFEGVYLLAELSEAVDDMVILGGDPTVLIDWARHFEMLAARLREAAC